MDHSYESTPDSGEDSSRIPLILIGPGTALLLLGSVGLIREITGPVSVPWIVLSAAGLILGLVILACVGIDWYIRKIVMRPVQLQISYLTRMVSVLIEAQKKVQTEYRKHDLKVDSVLVLFNKMMDDDPGDNVRRLPIRKTD